MILCDCSLSDRYEFIGLSNSNMEWYAVVRKSRFVMMAVLRNLSFRTKIFLYASIISSVSLILACFAFILYDNYSFRESLAAMFPLRPIFLGLAARPPWFLKIQNSRPIFLLGCKQASCYRCLCVQKRRNGILEICA